ncbi:uncharacterized protein MONBRDRAFT_27342 [Monosiga brevicollis MX1]|uniref:Receptor L-domain domain-containing protein n=1 Tax=Monosiga brevicollis TaxID=81824 RepID=A9V504_MONBE|nr:uncharacterized protein MONBRDRAFT_27342 [Monosiga brevicollis MX1]EDQ87544.1 predicted protein [Monosiga brevicollis MX1]|eukprot:XP_001747804.1 hypothetical protein [Monosiga brevicollis MX1]
MAGVLGRRLGFAVAVVVAASGWSLGGADPVIETDENGNLHIHNSPSSVKRILLNGVDVLKEIEELRVICGVDASTTAAPLPPTPTPVVFDGPVHCDLNGVPNNVTHVNGSIIFIGCTGSLASQLQVLQTVARVSGNVEISNNNALQTIDGLDELTWVGGSVVIEYNSALTGVDGLNSLETIGQDLTITLNPKLGDLDGLDQLSSVNDTLNIRVNNGLQNVDGLSRLTKIGGALHISNNAALESIEGLGSLVEVGDTVSVCSNPSLNATIAEIMLDNLGTCQDFSEASCLSC